MTFQAAMIMTGFMSLWAAFLSWVFSRIVDRAIKQVLIQQRLLEHSAARKAHPTLTEEQNALRSEVFQEAEREMWLSQGQGTRALRYTAEHRREAKRLRALEAEKLRIARGEPVSKLGGIAVGGE